MSHFTISLFVEGFALSLRKEIECEKASDNIEGVSHIRNMSSRRRFGIPAG